jgi:hypothetical protein
MSSSSVPSTYRHHLTHLSDYERRVIDVLRKLEACDPTLYAQGMETWLSLAALSPMLAMQVHQQFVQFAREVQGPTSPATTPHNPESTVRVAVPLAAHPPVETVAVVRRAMQ